MPYAWSPVPCCRCKGRVFRRKGNETPVCFRGDRFGFPGGRLCEPCYKKLLRRFYRVPPCVRCGTAGGFSHRGRAARYDVSFFGVSGAACYRCWLIIRSEVPRPCSKCGTEGGFTPKACVRPPRYSGEQFEINGLLCYRCYRAEIRVAKRQVRDGLAEVWATRERDGVPRTIHG